MSIGIFTWSVFCFVAGFAAYQYVQRFAWFQRLTDRVKAWSKGDE